MSKKSKTIAATAFLLGVAAVGAGTVNPTSVSAQTLSNTAVAKTERANHIASLVTALSQKFNLNSSDVQAVIDVVMTTKKSEMRVEREQNLATRLSKAVTDGKITQAQSALITAKIQETKVFMESLKTKTDEERKVAMKAYRVTLEKWATDNNIPKHFLAIAGHGDKWHGNKGHGGFGGDLNGEKKGNK